MKIHACFLRLVFVILFSDHLYNPATDAATTLGPSERLVRFMLLFASRFNNSGQVSMDKAYNETIVHDTIVDDIKPVIVPAFPGDICFLLIEVDNKIIFRVQILVVSEDAEGIIRMKPYNITYPGNVSMDNFDFGILDSLKPSDLSEGKECEITVEEIELNVFFGTWPDCFDFVNGQPSTYQFILTCNTVSTIVPYTTRETGNPRPYILPRIRYDLSDIKSVIGDVSSVKNPCTC